MIMIVVSSTTINCALAMTTRIHQWAREDRPVSRGRASTTSTPVTVGKGGRRASRRS